MAKASFPDIKKKDLLILSKTIQIPVLKEGIVDEDFAANLEECIEKKGHSVRWVSLDDMGFISITFTDGEVTETKVNDVFDCINELK